MQKSLDTPRIDAGPATVHWGFFDARLLPILTIDSGDRVTISTVSGTPRTDATAAFQNPAGVARHSCCKWSPPLVRPYVHRAGRRAGSKSGMELQVDIEAINLHYDWGYNVIRPLAGALPDDFPEYRPIHISLDKTRMMGQLPWGQEIPLRPFFGVIAVAPPPAWGTITTLPPRRNGGNLDNKELVAGTTLYLPIFTDGALLSVGDGHGAQGDGEVCVSAIETGLIGTFRLTVRNDIRLEWPLAETPTHMITMAFDPDLDDCAVIALRQMIDLVCARTRLDRYQAYALLSLAADLRVTQVVNGNKGIHVMLDKRYLTRD